MNNDADLSASWQAFAAWFAAHTPVRFGAGRGDVDGPLSSWFALVDGQEGAAVFDGGFTVMGADDASRDKAMLDTLAQREQWPSSWWSTAWFPFASDGAGQVLALDATSGEIIEFIHDDDARPLRAPSLAALLADTHHALEAGTLVFDVRVGVVDAQQQQRWQQQREQRLQEQAVAPPRWLPFAAVCIAVVCAALGWLLAHGE